MHDGQIILGVSNVPLMGERVWGAKLKGAFLNNRRIEVSATRRLSAATLSYAKSIRLPHDNKDRGMLRLLNAVGRQRAFGDLWPYHLLASGRIDIVVEIGIKAYDIAPFVCIIPEAGGRISNERGGPFEIDVSGFVATNGLLHRSVISCFNKNVR